MKTTFEDWKWVDTKIVYTNFGRDASESAKKRFNDSARRLNAKRSGRLLKLRPNIALKLRESGGNQADSRETE